MTIELQQHMDSAFHLLREIHCQQTQKKFMFWFHSDCKLDDSPYVKYDVN